MSATLQVDRNSQTLTSLLSDIASHRDKTALIEFKRDDVQSTSYAELSEQIQRLARGLRSDDSKSNTHTAVIAPLTGEWIVAALGTICAGRVLVPLDVQLSDDVLSGILEDSGAQLIFATRDQSERLEEIDLPDDIQVALLDQDEKDERSWLRLFGEEGDLPQPEPDDTAILFYTSEFGEWRNSCEFRYRVLSQRSCHETLDGGVSGPPGLSFSDLHSSVRVSYR
jgi:acyl-CoA synthetase (AMP-forming)/AMP-acid ligase II